MCLTHASPEMVDVVNKVCSHTGCLTRACYGVVGSKKAEVCLAHSVAGMSNIKSGRRFSAASTEACAGIGGGSSTPDSVTPIDAAALSEMLTRRSML